MTIAHLMSTFLPKFVRDEKKRRKKIDNKKKNNTIKYVSPHHHCTDKNIRIIFTVLCKIH